jgi:phage I-like protein
MLRTTAHLVSLHAASSEAVALCAAVDLPAEAAAPEWVHLLPAGELRTGDGRGPYRVVDAAEVIAGSLQAFGDAGVIDENHATDLAAPRGEAAPARGWIKELQARADGIWGRVEWTAAGRRLVQGRAYRGISPVIQHTKDGRVTAILRASLVNRPNLRGLTALHQENDMDLLARLLTALGLPATTTEAAALAAVTTLHAEALASTTALQAALDPIAIAVGLQAGAEPAAVLLGVQQKTAGAGGDDATIAALQAELVTVTTLNTLVADGKKKAAESFVDGAIKAGRVGVKPQRDRFVTMHMADAANAEALVNALPVLGNGGVIVPPPVPLANGEVSLNAEQRLAAKLLGIPEKDYAATLKEEREAAL